MMIKTDRLYIRFAEAKDWESIKTVWTDFNRSSYVYYDTPHNTEDEDVRQRIARWAEATTSGKEHLFFVVCIEEKVIGFFALHALELGHEISYGFQAAYQGHGYARESMLALIDYFREIGIEHICAGTALDNKPSVKLLESTGFRLTATEKVSFYKDSDGNNIYFDGGIFELTIENR